MAAAAWQTYNNEMLTWICRVEGCSDYNSSTHAGTWVDLGFSVESKPASEGTWIEAEATTFAQRAVNAIRLVWDYMPGPKVVDEYWACLHDIEVNGSTIRYATCQLTDDAGNVGKPEYLYAPASFEKLRGGILATSGPSVAGTQRCKAEEIGCASEHSALSMARIILLTSLRMHGLRRYIYEGVHPGTPELGMTVACVEDGATTYTGILREYAFAIGECGITSTTGTVLSTATAVIE